MNSSSRKTENTSLETQVIQRIIPVLNTSTESLPDSVTDRLAKARQAALQRQKLPIMVPVVELNPALAGHGHHVDPFESNQQAHHSETPLSFWKRLRRLGLFWPLLVLLAGLLGIAEWQQSSQIDDLAEIDSQLLSDDLPPQAYSDPGFKAFLNNER